MSRKFNMPNLDEDLDIMDLDEEEVAYNEIDEEDFVNEEAAESEGLDEEFMAEEPYVVPVTEDMFSGEPDLDDDKAEMVQEYDESEEAFERAEPEKKSGERVGFMSGLLSRFLHMDTMDKVIMALGCVVLVLAIIAVSVFTSYRATESQVMAFADIGKDIDEIALIGESGLLAVTDATMARIDALNEVEEEEEEEEEDVTTSVVVKMNFTSIQKDLKIKFTNKKSGKLIAGIPFAVEVQTPSGKNLDWSDEDKDGIIYYKNIEPGKYYITLKELEGEVYERYVLDTSTQTATVKKDIDYVQVDVSDEILDESEIDASKEDTELGNTVESALTDTVKWVPSKVVSGGKDYVEVKKSDIVAPTTTTRLLGNNSGIMMMMMSADVTISGLAETASVEVGKTITLTVNAGENPVTWATDKPDVATVDGGVVTGVSAGTANITATAGAATKTCVVTVTAPAQQIAVTVSPATAEVEVEKTTPLTATVTGTETKTVTWKSLDETVATVDSSGLVKGLKAGTATITATSTVDNTKSAACTVTVKESSAALSITLDKTTAEVAIGKDITLKATTEPADGVTVKWETSDATIAKVDANGKVTGVKAGEATIKAIAEMGTKKIEISCKITVVETARKVTLDNTKLEMTAGEEKTLNATVEGYTSASEGKVTWTTSDKTVATVDDKGKVTALKEGTVKITATNTENNIKVEAVCEITVKAGVSLKTKDGSEVYILKGDQYVKATAADYAKDGNVFYVYKDVNKYQGWQTIDGKMYYYTEDYKKVTGEQVIMGAKYVFDSNGVLTSSTGVMGIDVSKWNGTIDWNQVKASGVNYVIIRCGYRGSSQGALIEDPKYKVNIDGATKAGLKVGVYFFSQAVDEVEAVQEASMVLSLVKGYKISYPIFLDVEASGGRADNISKETRTAVCKAFCKTIQNSGYTAGVYANKTWLTSKIDTSQLGNYKIWLAQYASQPTYTGRYEIWQYKDSGSVPGISGHVDLNLSYLGY